jgi:hypothetical protein
VLRHHPNSPRPDLRCVPRLPAHRSILSRVGASGKPGAVQSMSGLLEQDRLQIGVGIAEVKVELQKALQQVELQNQKAQNDVRCRELDTLAYEAQLAKQQRILAEETAKADAAAELAKLRVDAERARAEQELCVAQCALTAAQVKADRAQHTRQADLDEADDGDPEEFRQAMKTQRRRDNTNRAAAKREADILKRVDGDESLLTEEEIDELEGIRQAKVRAQRAADASSALGAIFPYADDEEEEQRS